MRLLSVLSVSVLAGALTGCGAASNSDYNFACPAQRLIQLSLLDVSADGRDETLLGERLDAIQVDAERVADCEGDLTVVAWSESSSTSAVLYKGSINTTGASEIGRDRRLPEVVSGVMNDIRGKLNDLFAKAPASGHDLVAAFSIINDFARSHSLATNTLSVHVFADGISTVGSGSINLPFLTSDQVATIVSQQQLPDLSDIEVSLYGIGRVGGADQPPQQVVAVATDYAQQLCNSTGAKCSVFTTNIAS